MDDGECKWDGSKPPREGGNNGSKPVVGYGGEQACTGDNWSIVCLPKPETSIDYSELPLNPFLNLPPLQSGDQPTTDPDAGQLFWETLYPFIDALDNANNYGKPVYKHLKYALPTGGWEALVDAGLQMIADTDNNLKPHQITIRAGVVGVESYFTDLASDVGGLIGAGAGELAFPTGGGIPGFILGSYGTSLIIDNAFKQINTWAFPVFGLGDYP